MTIVYPRSKIVDAEVELQDAEKKQYQGCQDESVEAFHAAPRSGNPLREHRTGLGLDYAAISMEKELLKA